MSLINDALKKAARQRAEEQGEVPPSMPGGGRRSSRKGEPMRKQTLILVAAAAVALVVVSVVITGMFMTGKPEAKPLAAAMPTPETAAPEAEPKIVVQAPVIAVSLPQVAAPVAVARPSPSPAPIIEAPSPVTPAPAVSAPVSPAPVASAQQAGAAPQGHNDMVQAVVDGFNISGVRTAGAGSKALINGHVYKLNDLVDKAIGLRLVKVDEDQLTFVDRDGGTFVKTF